MKNQIIVSIAALLLILSGCNRPVSFTEAENIKKEVNDQFTEMLKLSEANNLEDFKAFISDDASLVVEGIYLADKDVADYFFEIFKSLGHQNTLIKSNVYNVLSRTLVYQEAICYPSPTDTAHGIVLKPAPIKLIYLSQTDAGMKESMDNERGTAVYVIDGADSSKIATLGYRMPPIKMLGLSVIMEKSIDKWVFKNGHLSLGLKSSKTYKLNKQEFKY